MTGERHRYPRPGAAAGQGEIGNGGQRRREERKDGFELFDKPNWVGSEFDEQVNYQRALEGELEHTVGYTGRYRIGAGPSGFAPRFVVPRTGASAKSLSGFEAAPSHAGRRRAGRDSQPGLLGGGRAHARIAWCWWMLPAICHWGRRPPKRLLLSAEQALEDKLVATLEPVTGAGNVRASVTLDYDRCGHRRDPGDLRSEPDGDAIDAANRADDRAAAGGRRRPGNGLECPQLPGAAGVSATKPLRRNRRRPESGTYGVSKTVTTRGGESRPRAANDCGDRGQRSDDAAGHQDQRRACGSRGRPTSSAI